MHARSVPPPSDWARGNAWTPGTFDLALKEFGINSPWLRDWIGKTIREQADLPVKDQRDAWGPYYWLPPSRQYLAVGYELFIGRNGHEYMDGLKRSAHVQRTTLRIAEHTYDGTPYSQTYRWRTVHFPSTSARRGGMDGTSGRANSCSTCHVQLPRTGVCDTC